MMQAKAQMDAAAVIVEATAAGMDRLLIQLLVQVLAGGVQKQQATQQSMRALPQYRPIMCAVVSIVERGCRRHAGLYRFLMMGLLASGYNMTDGKVLEPGVGPMGNRTTDVQVKASSMKNIRKILRPAAALLLSLAAADALAGSQSVSVSIIGPGSLQRQLRQRQRRARRTPASIMLIEGRRRRRLRHPGRQLGQLHRRVRRLHHPDSG